MCPGSQAAAARVVQRRISPAFQEYVVDEVLGLASRSEHAVAEREGARGQSIVELAERGAVSAGDLAQQFGVGWSRRGCCRRRAGFDRGSEPCARTPSAVASPHASGTRRELERIERDRFSVCVDSSRTCVATTSRAHGGLPWLCGLTGSGGARAWGRQRSEEAGQLFFDFAPRLVLGGFWLLLLLALLRSVALALLLGAAAFALGAEW